MIEWVMNNAVLITVIFAAIYVLATLGEHWLKKRKEAKDGEKPNDRNRTSHTHSR